MVPFERVIVIFYKLSIVTTALSLGLTIRPQFAIGATRVEQFGQQNFLKRLLLLFTKPNKY